MWSVATPIWHAPDEMEHFIYADLLAESGQLPEDKEYELDFNISKSAGVSKLYSYAWETPPRRFIYDGRYAPFERKLDDPIKDIKELEDIFVGIPAIDILALSEPAGAKIIERQNKVISVDLAGYLKDKKSGGRGDFLLYALKSIELAPGIVQLKKSAGLFFKNGMLEKIVDPYGDEPDILIENGVAYFTKTSEEKVELKEIVAGREKKRHSPRAYASPPLYYSLTALILKVVDLSDGGILSGVFFSRMFCVFLSVLAAFYVYKTFKVIWPGQEEFALSGMLLYSFWPLNSFEFGVMSPENIMNLFCAISFYYIARIIFTEEPTDRDWIFFSVMAALAAFSKVAGVLMVAVWWPGLLLYTLIRYKRVKLIHFLPPTLMFVGPYLLWFRAHGFGKIYGTGLNLSFWKYLKLHGADFYLSYAGIFGVVKNVMPQPAYLFIAFSVIVLMLILLYGLLKGFEDDDKLRFGYIFACTMFSFAFFFVIEFLKLADVGAILHTRHFLLLASPFVVMLWASFSRQRDDFIKSFGEALGYVFLIALIFINGYALFDYAAQNFIL